MKINKIKNFKKIVVITLSFLLMFSLVIPSAQNNVYAEGQETPVEERTEDSENAENVDNDKEEKEANDEDKQEEKIEEVEEIVVEEEDENITNEITEPSQSSGEHSNRSNIYDLPDLAPSLEAVNVGTYTPVVLLDAATGIRYSYARDGLIQYSIIEMCHEEELRRNADGGITIPNVIGGYPVRGIRNHAFDNERLRGKLIFQTVGQSYQLFIGNGAFAGNQITSVEGDIVKQRLFETRCAGYGIFQDNQIRDITGFFNSPSGTFQEYSIPGLTFEGNRIQFADFTTSKYINSIGAMAFANNQMQSIRNINDNITIYSGAFFNNMLRTDSINSLPNTVIFSTSTSDEGPYFDILPSFNYVDTKRREANGNPGPTIDYSEGLGAFQKNLLTTVPTVKAGWKFGYRTFAANNITGDLVFDTALMNASASSEGLFIANPITSISFPDLSGVTSTQAVIPKEFLARRTSANTNFRECPDVEMLSGHVLEYFNPVKNTANKVVPRIIKEGAFRGTNIKEIRYLRYTKEIEKEAFAYCTDLETLGLRVESNPRQAVSALYHVYTIGEKAFYQCINLSGDIGLSARVDIGKYAFAMTDNVTDTYDSSIVSPPLLVFSL